jgi:hypothetical protein
VLDMPSKYAKFWNFDPFLNKIATFFYGPIKMIILQKIILKLDEK